MTDSPFTPAQLETGRRFLEQDVQFVMGVAGLSQLPPDIYPEIAFAGRSNVGKSSLINALLSRKNIARASNTPGRTRELNYFLLAQVLYLVDLPGYGYAKASKSDIANWTKLTFNYLRGRASLQRVFLLIDGRRGVMDNDREVMDLFDTSAVVYQVVLTKADKLKAKERDKVLHDTMFELAKRPASHPLIHLTSSEKGTGLAELRADITQLAPSDWDARSRTDGV